MHRVHLNLLEVNHPAISCSVTRIERGKDEKILACSMLQISLKSKLSIFNLIKKLKQELNVVIKEKLKHLNFTS